MIFMREPIFEDVRKTIYLRSNCCCEFCSQNKFLQLHHKVKVEHGGKNTAENLLLLCRNCHQKEHKRGVDKK